MTNGVQSYALYTYRCGELEWSGGATIGFGASNETYANLRLSGSAGVLAVACLNSPTTEWSNVLFRLTLDTGTHMHIIIVKYYTLNQTLIRMQWHGYHTSHDRTLHTNNTFQVSIHIVSCIFVCDSFHSNTMQVH